MTRRLVSLTVSVLCLLALPGTAGAVAESSSWGKVSATVSYEIVHGMFGPEANAQLTITRVGQVYSYTITSRLPNCKENTCVPYSFPSGRSLEVVELESDGEPDVLLHLWSGGAHCCFIDQIFSWNPSTLTYGVTEHSWGDPGEHIADLRQNGQLELVTADDRFAYAFTSYAYSGLPVQIYVFRSGALVDTSRSYAAQLAADAAEQFHRYLANWRAGLGLGFLAAWVADEYRLGKRAYANRTLQRENRLGHLHGERYFPTGGSKFIKQLGRFLRKNGYG